MYNFQFPRDRFYPQLEIKISRIYCTLESASQNKTNVKRSRKTPACVSVCASVIRKTHSKKAK